MKYTIEVSMTYTDVVEVEAETPESAEYMAFYEFNLDKATRSESQCYVLKTEGATA